jgi:CO/xanthine dehydrogenase FAD-binding subunit
MASPAIRNIATMGGNIGHASPAGDSLPMLYALGAQLTLQSGEGQSVVNLAEFITGPGQTVLKDHEIIRHIRIPLDDYNRLYYRKVGTRRANGIAKLSVFAVARAVKTRLDEIRISFGAVAPTVVRSQKAEALLKTLWPGQISARLEEVQAYYAPLITPVDDIRSGKAYRLRVAFRLLQECLRGFSEKVR